MYRNRKIISDKLTYRHRVKVDGKPLKLLAFIMPMSDAVRGLKPIICTDYEAGDVMLRRNVLTYAPKKGWGRGAGLEAFLGELSAKFPEIDWDRPLKDIRDELAREKQRVGRKRAAQ